MIHYSPAVNHVDKPPGHFMASFERQQPDGHNGSFAEASWDVYVVGQAVLADLLEESSLPNKGRVPCKFSKF